MHEEDAMSLKSTPSATATATAVVEDGVYPSACRMCHGGCGALIHVEDGQVRAIEGDPHSPLNEGRLCPKGAASLAQLQHPDRLRHPLRRVGPRGSGDWERVSWDEALADIAAQLTEIRTHDGPEAIALGTGTGRHHFHFVPRFANALGTPNWCEPGTAQCFLPRINTCVLTFGEYPVCDYFGDVSPACILAWGHNPLDSGPDGEIGFLVKRALKKDPKLIVVDPRRTSLAKKADLWLQLRPGTDDALALAMLQVLIEEELYDADFVEEWTFGFEALADRVRSNTPEWAEPITWVPADQIREAARLFARTRPGVVEWGCAIEQTPNSIQTVRAVSMLPALTGNLEVPGGWVFGMHALGAFPYLAEHLPPEAAAKRLGGEQFKVLGGGGSILPSAHGPSVFRAMREGDPYRVSAFLVFGNNALVTYANSREVRESLLALDLLVVTDLYMTPTAELADYVLPAASWPEVEQVIGLPFVAENTVLPQQKTAQVGECRQDEEIMIELARRMELDAGTESLREVLDAQLAAVLGISFEELVQRGHESLPLRYEKYKQIGGFLTPSRKVELYSNRLESLGYDPLPYYQEPPESPLSTPELAREYPLVLITGGRIPFFFNSEFRQLPKLRRARPDPRVEVHPDTAGKLGIADGDPVRITTRRGSIEQMARVTGDIDPRVVQVEHGWWFPEEDGPEYGVWRSNANLLTSNAPPYDPAMGTYQLRALLCRLEPISPGACRSAV
jgi:thiosulfate reductase/polysulfide reductase chain A